MNATCKRASRGVGGLTPGTRCCIGCDTGAGDIAVVRISPIEHRIIYLDDDAVQWSEHMTGVIKEAFFRTGYVRKISNIQKDSIDKIDSESFRKILPELKKTSMLSNSLDDISVLHYRVVLDIDGTEQIIPSSLVKKI